MDKSNSGRDTESDAGGVPGVNRDRLMTREWLVTNGLGGYASGTASGACTRKYHGLLVAALPNPLGRRMMFNHLTERLRLPDGRVLHFGGDEHPGRAMEPHARHLVEFRLELGLPVWAYDFDGTVLEKRVFLPHGENTVHVNYRLVSGGGPVRLLLRPSVHFRPHGDPPGELTGPPYAWSEGESVYELSAGTGPPLRLRLDGESAAFAPDPRSLPDILYPVEERRGYQARGGLWTPGHFEVDLSAGRDVTLTGSAEPCLTLLARDPEGVLAGERERRRKLLAAAGPVARCGFPAELVLAADQFIIKPPRNPAGGAPESKEGSCTVIAGYHWFTDWGRDTMIGLEGLMLLTGRHEEAGHCLRMFAGHLRDGLIPNLFPEGKREGVYNTADATLWLFHAIGRYLEYTADRALLRLLLPDLRTIIERHLGGTRFGIGVDPADGLLRQGAEGYALTWMDAKVGDWVVTPRRGKAVEINALWYNALRLLEGWVREGEGEAAARPYAAHAEKAKASFNRRFWYEAGGHLYDVVDAEGGADDPSCRPNQVLAISLTHPILDRERWERVIAVVRERLLTPVGLRTLAPGHPDYHPNYFGDVRARDAAYHQGTVWPWLVGSFVDAWLKVRPDDLAGARRFLDGLVPHLREACIGSVSEVFDAEKPFTPRGCVAQAWSVAEVLRAWMTTRDTEEAASSAEEADRR
ncbi:MAG: amylo-alpha-1,6-glucosidase [Gemmataceae bacterium]|nr:amylo-alpha-1,6-glucosidase [Gemmataceae bacterium]